MPIFVASHGAVLHMYQGEDVSLGIWLDESPLKRSMRWVDAGGGSAGGAGGAGAMFSELGPQYIVCFNPNKLHCVHVPLRILVPWACLPTAHHLSMTSPH